MQWEVKETCSCSLSHGFGLPQVTSGHYRSRELWKFVFFEVEENQEHIEVLETFTAYL